MRGSTNCLGGSPGFPLRVTKKADDSGTYECYAESFPDLKFEGDSEIDAIRTAERELRDRLLRGELQS
jgi:hypothetical protein